MREFAYGSLNAAIQTAWTAITSDPIIFGHPTPPATLPASCLRVYWLTHGGPDFAPGVDLAVVQLDIFLIGAGSAQPIATALTRADTLDGSLGVTRANGLYTLNMTDNAAVVVGRLSLKPDTAGWVQVPTKTLRQIQLSRRIHATWNTG